MIPPKILANTFSDSLVMIKKYKFSYEDCQFRSRSHNFVQNPHDSPPAPFPNLLKVGPEPLEKESHEFLGSKRDD